MGLEGSTAPSGQPDSGYNYVVTAQKPTAVTASAVGHFTGSSDINLIISKTTRIEIHTLAEGLQGVADVPIYGRIAAMELFRPPGKDKDLLFLLTETHQFAVLGYDASTGELVTHALGDAESKVGRLNENGSMALVDPLCRMIGVHIYDGLIKIIPIDERGKLQEAFDVRIDELCLIDAKFLDASPAPTLAVLYMDPQRDLHIKSYTVSLKDRTFSEGPWAHSNLDPGATMIIPVPGPLGGAIVVGESVITYFNKGELKTVPLERTTVRAYGQVDEDGSRYLLGDIVGNLYLLVLNHDGQRVLGLKLQSLGRTSAPSSIAYLDNAVVFIGSSTGDSQLVRLHPEAVDPEQPSNFVEVLDTFTNLGSIIDMCVVDLDRQGQCQIVTCSGARTDGSLRIVRNGIGMVGQATVELPGIRGIWSLRAAFDDAHDSLLVLTFVGETRLLAINDEDELEEAEPEGFDADAQSLYCGNAVGDTLAQVTPKGVRLLSAAGKQLVHEWKAPEGLQINIASGNASQVLLACGEGNLVLLEVSGGQLREAGRARLSSDVACLDITPLQPGGEAASLAAVGTWDHAVHLLRLPDLGTVRSEPLGVDVIPRSVLFSSLEGISYLLVALGDGQLFNFHLQPGSAELSERKKISLGTKPISLSSFRSNGNAYVFAASDRPTVIYSSSQKLLYSNLNENEVNFMAPFNSRSFPDSLAIAKEGSLTIGTIDEVQKLHIRSVPLGSQPRRVCHLPSAQAFLLVTEPVFEAGVGDSALHLLDEQTFESLDRFTLDSVERGTSICTARFAEDPADYVALGTAYVLPDEAEPSKGRVLIFQVKDGKLHLTSQKEVNGAVYTIAAFQGKLLLGCNSRVQIFKWARQDDGSSELSLECTHTGHVLALQICCRGDFIVVGDLMRSIDVLVYKAEEGVLEQRARDFNSAWMTAVEILDDDTYLGADNSYNFFAVRKNADAASDEDRGRLEVIGEYHLGDMVNRFRHGSLVMQLTDGDTPRIPTVLFGTITGVIGVVASLPPNTYALLEKLQSAIRKVIKGVGGLDHTAWRLRKNDRGVLGCRNFVDGDLVEQFLDLKKDGMQKVVDIMGGEMTVEELTRLIEELSRSLH